MAKTKLTNIDTVCIKYAYSSMEKGNCGNVSFDGNKFYSYSTVICVRLKPDLFGGCTSNQPVYFMCTSSYSVTTAHHKSKLWSSLKGTVLELGDIDYVVRFKSDLDERDVIDLVLSSIDVATTPGTLNLNRREDRLAVLNLHRDVHVLMELYPKLEEELGDVIINRLDTRAAAANTINEQRKARYNK